jgi:hypothetical protein
VQQLAFSYFSFVILSLHEQINRMKYHGLKTKNFD